MPYIYFHPIVIWRRLLCCIRLCRSDHRVQCLLSIILGSHLVGLEAQGFEAAFKRIPVVTVSDDVVNPADWDPHCSEGRHDPPHRYCPVRVFVHPFRSLVIQFGVVDCAHNKDCLYLRCKYNIIKIGFNISLQLCEPEHDTPTK